MHHQSCWTHLNGAKSNISSTESTLPYHGQMMNIWDEYEMNDIRNDTKPMNIRPTILPISGVGGWALTTKGGVPSGLCNDAARSANISTERSCVGYTQSSDDE